MHFLQQFANYAFFTTPFLESLLLLIVIRRKLYLRIPWFLIYVVFQILEAIILYLVHKSDPVFTYYFAYWALNGISIALAMMMLLEVFSALLAKYPGLEKLGRYTLAGAAIVLLLLALATAAHGRSGYDFSSEVVLILARSVRLLQFGLVVFMFLFSAYFGLKWVPYAYGIALGYAIFAAVDLSSTAISAELGPKSQTATTIASVSAYLVAELIWCAFMLKKDVAVRPMEVPNSDLERWNEALLQILKVRERGTVSTPPAA